MQRGIYAQVAQVQTEVWFGALAFYYKHRCQSNICQGEDIELNE
jgi:hypothetical protein